METDAEALEACASLQRRLGPAFGYGRNNVRRSLEILRDKKIPPEADILRPRWFQTIDPSRHPELPIIGHWLTDSLILPELSVAEGPTPTPEDFTSFANGNGL